MFGANVVVAQAKCLAERQLEHLLRRAVERRQRGQVTVCARRQRHRLGDLAGVDALAGEQLDRQPVGVVEHRQQQVVGVDLGVAGLVGLVLGSDDDVARPRGESAEAGIGVECVGVAGGLGDEALLGGLLGDAHALADLGPRRPGPARLVDEVADEVVGDLAEGLGGQHRIGELLERFLVHLLDDVDEVVEADGVGDLRGLGHGVNSRLTMLGSSTSG